MSLLSIRNLHARLGRVQVLEGASLDVAAGELAAVVGPNGAGKSTLLRTALGLHPASRGEARLDGAPVTSLDPTERAMKVGYLPQERRLAWGLPAVEVAALGAPLETPARAQARALEALARFGIEGLANRSVFELSGGERARVLLARLFATQAPLLVADEPTAGLDPDAQLLCLDQLKAHTRDGGAVLTTLHDLSLAARYADRVVVLDAGKVTADGPPQSALSPDILRAVFGLRARWMKGGDGPVLDAGRA